MAWIYSYKNEINSVFYDTSQSRKRIQLNEESLIKILYPDKMKNLNGISLNVTIYNENSRVYGTKMYLNYFLKIIEEKINVKIAYDQIMFQCLEDLVNQYNERRNNRVFIFSPNTYYLYGDPPTKLISYEESSICILVPIPPEESFGSDILIKPFDGAIWISLGVTLIITGIFWKLLSENGSDSSWRYIYGIIGYLLGQGVLLRNQNLSLKIILQLVILMTIILSNCYNGAIKSILVKSSDNRLSTFDEVLSSKYTLLVGSYHDLILNDFENYKTAKLQGKVNVSGHILKTNYSLFYELNFAFILPCATADDRIYGSKFAAPYFYILPEKLFPSLLRLDAGYRNPYINRIQQIMDECFAAGLHQAWNIFYGKIQKNIQKPVDNRAITLKDVNPVFVIWIMGNLFAVLILIAEIIINAIKQYRHRRVTVASCDVI